MSESPQPTAERLLTGAFALACLSNFLHSLSLHTYIHVAGFLEGLGLAEVWIGVVIGVGSLTAIVSRPPLGRIMDRQGRRVVILVGGVLSVLACMGYLLVQTPGPLLVGVRIVHGIAQAALFSGMFTLAADIVPSSRRAEGIALFGISGLLPLGVGGLLGDWAVQGDDYSLLFQLTAAFALVAWILSLPLRESRPPNVEGEQVRYIDTVRSPALVPIWVLGTLYATALSAYFAFLKTYVEETGVGSVGMFFAAYSISAILLRLVGGRLPERIGYKRVLFPALVIAAGGLVLVANATMGWQLSVAGVMCGLGHGYAFPILSAMVIGRARASERGAAVSLFTALFDLGMLIGGPTLGLAIGFGGYSFMYAVAASVLVGAILVFAIWDRRVDQRVIS